MSNKLTELEHLANSLKDVAVLVLSGEAPQGEITWQKKEGKVVFSLSVQVDDGKRRGYINIGNNS